MGDPLLDPALGRGRFPAFRLSGGRMHRLHRGVGCGEHVYQRPSLRCPWDVGISDPEHFDPRLLRISNRTAPRYSLTDGAVARCGRDEQRPQCEPSGGTAAGRFYATGNRSSSGPIPTRTVVGGSFRVSMRR